MAGETSFSRTQLTLCLHLPQMRTPKGHHLNTGGMLDVLSLSFQQKQVLSLACLHTMKLGWHCAGDQEAILQASAGLYILMISSGSSMHGLLLQYVLHLADIRSNRG